MKLSEIFSQFKKIEPDARYAERSRGNILASPRNVQSVPVKGMVVALRIVETGVGLVLAGFFILIITGSFLSPKTISPVQYSVIDPAGLHAEANAIDMQIQLAEVEYPESATSAPESTVATATAMNSAARISTPVEAPLSAVPASSSTASSSPSSTGTGTSTVSSSYSIDQALEQLSK